MKIVVCGVLLGISAVSGFAAEEGIFSYKVGRFEVFMLVENQGQGRSSLLIGANARDIEQYVPGGTYQSETNTFLIRTGEKIILVDTGFGGALFDHLKALGVDPAQVDVVLLTHMHGDHIGGLQKGGKPLFPRATVYLAQEERAFWAGSPNAVAALAPYGDKVVTFRPGELGAAIPELLPGITPIAAFGHTPGHTLYLVQSGTERLLIWGDLMHVQGIQFPLPGVSVTYDTDPAEAAAIRTKVLEYAARNNIPIGGMHLVYPAIGTVTPQGSGYQLTPPGR
ncbi:MAG: MBL fold metallo-hydrolase [Spirochaetaceae bacterium]|jgi:glyoxylase-like metal-dependent hydrolase (beta-lactamase superfamily II)|nr:MBL fold metallo-hydrolase [Spirochaetaceae bacterium]